jgi:hypothetical protein
VIAIVVFVIVWEGVTVVMHAVGWVAGLGVAGLESVLAVALSASFTDDDIVI